MTETESNLPEFYSLILKTRQKLQKLNSGHISGKDLLTHYVLPLFATLHDELDEAIEDLADAAVAVDDDVADQVREAIIALATFTEKQLVAAGLIARENAPDGSPIIKATEKTPAGLLEELAEVNAQVVAALSAIADQDADDEEDEDADEDDESDEGETEDAGSEEGATDSAVEAPAA